MKFIKSFSSKKFLIRIAAWFAATLLLAIGLFSAVLYFTSKSIFMKNEYDYSRNILYQVKYNIELMDTDVKNLCRYLYINPDVTQVANSTGNLDIVEVTRIMNKLSMMTGNTTPFVDSICIYNSYKDQYFYGGKELYFNDQGLKKIINNYPEVPKLKPISRTITVEYGNKVEKVKVFTYIMYETSGDKKQIDSAVVVNVKAAWLLDNLRMLNKIERNDGDNVFVLDRDSNFIDDEADINNMKASLKSEYGKHRPASPEISGIFECVLLGKKYVVTYLEVETAGFTLLKTQPYAKAYSYAGALKTTTAVVTIIFFFIALLISMTVSKRLYKPLGNLVSSISGNAQKTPPEMGDEISYLSKVYKYSLEKLNYYDKERHEYKSVLRTNWLRKMLLDMDGSIDEERYSEVKEVNMLTLPFKGPFVVCVLQIDNFRIFQSTNDMKERELIRFAIINIASELISHKFVVDGVDIKEDHVALIICVGENSDYMIDLESALREARRYIEQFFFISFTASISEEKENINEVPSLYSSALNKSAYRMALGRASIITPQVICKNIANTGNGYSQSHEKKLAEQVKAKNMNGFEKVLQEVIKEILMVSYDNMIVSLLRLIDDIKRMLEEQIKTCSEPVYIKLPAMNRVIFEYETLDDILREILQAVREILDNLLNDDETDILANAIAAVAKDIIDKNYHDKALCLTQIAETMKLSSRRLSKLFKENMHVSLPEYINEVRLAKAIEWLQKSDLTINEIIEKIGVENESYFYIMFKKKYGTSPKEYVLKNNLKKISG